MTDLEKVKQSLAAVKQKQSKLFKEKAASPLEIMSKAKVYAEEIKALEEKIREIENANL